MTPSKPLSVRLQLSEHEARALHSALLEATAASLLSPAHVDAAQCVLERLGARVPGWLERSVVRGEAGYVIAADAVLKTLVEAEEHGRTALSQIELAHELGDEKPVGVTIDDVLARMRRERLIRSLDARDGTTSWLTAAPAGRRQLNAKAGPTGSDEWRVEDSTALLELIYREHRPWREAHRPCVQAIGRLSDERFDALAGEPRADALLEPPGDDINRLMLTDRGVRLAEERARASCRRAPSCGNYQRRRFPTCAACRSAQTDTSASAPAETGTPPGCSRGVERSCTRLSAASARPSGNVAGAVSAG